MDTVNNGSKNVEEKKMETTLKQLISLIKDVDSILLEDNDKNREILKRFLRARKFNVERALKSIKKYIKLKTTEAKLLKESRPKVFKSLYAKHSAAIMKNKDAEGRQVVWLKTSNPEIFTKTLSIASLSIVSAHQQLICIILLASWDPAEFTLLQWLLSIYLILEEMVLSEYTQRNGIIVVFDFHGFCLNQLRHISLKPLQLMAGVLQETLPLSFKQIHIVNESVFFKIAWAMIKPFIKEKMRQRIQFHGEDLGTLQKFISPSILPSELGGELSLERALDSDYLNTFLQKNSLYTL